MGLNDWSRGILQYTNAVAGNIGSPWVIPLAVAETALSQAENIHIQGRIETLEETIAKLEEQTKVFGVKYESQAQQIRTNVEPVLRSIRNTIQQDIVQAVDYHLDKNVREMFEQLRTGNYQSFGLLRELQQERSVIILPNMIGDRAYDLLRDPLIGAQVSEEPDFENALNIPVAQGNQSVLYTVPMKNAQRFLSQLHLPPKPVEEYHQGESAIVADSGRSKTTVRGNVKTIGKTTEVTIKSKKYRIPSSEYEAIKECRISEDDIHVSKIEGKYHITHVFHWEKGWDSWKTYWIGDEKYSEHPDYSPLSVLTKLQTLYLSGNELEDLSCVDGLTQIKFLDVSNNNLEDISCLLNLSNIRTLDIDNSDIKDIHSLWDMRNLRALYARRNKIVDVSPLQNLGRLEEVHLERNQIRDARPLGSIPKLKVAKLADNPLGIISKAYMWLKYGKSAFQS